MTRLTLTPLLLLLAAVMAGVHADSDERWSNVKVLNNRSEFDAFVADNDYVAVGFFPESLSFEPYTLMQCYADTSIDLKNSYRFGLVRDPALLGEFEALGSAQGRVAMFHNGRFTVAGVWDGVQVFDKVQGDDMIDDDLWEFLKLARRPPVGIYSHSTKRTLYRDQLPMILIFSPSVNEQARNVAPPELEAALRVQADFAQFDYTFALVDKARMMPTLGKAMRLDEVEAAAADADKVLVGVMERDRSYVQDAEAVFSEEMLRDFVQSYFDGELTARVQSERAADNGGREQAKVVIGDTFSAEVMRPDAHVFLMLHAPWCGHCKKFMSTLQQLAQHYQGRPDVVIAKMDATNNQYPTTAFPVSGYPSFFFVGAEGQPEVVKYTSKDRSFAAVRDFIDDEVARVEGGAAPRPQSSGGDAGASAGDGGCALPEEKGVLGRAWDSVFGSSSDSGCGDDAAASPPAGGGAKKAATAAVAAGSDDDKLEVLENNEETRQMIIDAIQGGKKKKKGGGKAAAKAPSRRSAGTEAAPPAAHDEPEKLVIHEANEATAQMIRDAIQKPRKGGKPRREPSNGKLKVVRGEEARKGSAPDGYENVETVQGTKAQIKEYMKRMAEENAREEL